MKKSGLLISAGWDRKISAAQRIPSVSSAVFPSRHSSVLVLTPCLCPAVMWEEEPYCLVLCC